jgi:hypothetical protein
MIIKLFIWMGVLALFHALNECQIEGRWGWARHLPTFRINVFFYKFLGGKPLTGYHLYMLLMFITIFHGVFLFQEWTARLEMTIFGYFSWYFVMEDFLFFVVNPHYRLRHFKKGHIEWHKRWFWGLPYTYWWGMIIGTALLLLGGIK